MYALLQNKSTFSWQLCMKFMYAYTHTNDYLSRVSLVRARVSTVTNQIRCWWGGCVVTCSSAVQGLEFRDPRKCIHTVHKA